MDYNSTYEQEIDLKDLMFSVLHKWRPIVLVAIVLAVLLGGVKGALTYRKQNDPEVIEEANKKYEDDLALYEKNKESCEREINNLMSDITNQQEYLEKSTLINMSPYDVCEARTDLYITTDYTIMPGMAYQNVDYTDTIMQAYQSILTSSACMEDIAKNAGMEPRYLKELVTVTAGTYANEFNRLLTIKVRHTSKQKAQAVLDDILAQVDELQARVTESVGEHSINTVNDSLGSLVDLSLADKQRSENERLTKLNDSLETKQKELEDMEEPEKTVSSKMAALKSGIKYAVVGGVLGAFLIIFFECVAFLMSDKLYSAKELRYRYKVKILGKLSSKSNKKIGKIDAWINRMEGRAYNVSEEKECSLIVANIRNYAEDIKTLLVTGSANAELVERVQHELVGQLPEMKVFMGGNMLKDAETLKKLPECDGVVLVEQYMVSKYSSVEVELERVADLQKKVVGCVVFE